MMLTRDKKIGKSIYRIVKDFNGMFHIMEIWQGQMAVAPVGYTLEDAIQTLNTFDREHLVLKEV